MISGLLTGIILSLCAIFPWAYASHEAGEDASKIEANEYISHPGNLVRRGCWALGCTVLVLFGAGWGVAGAYVLYFAGVFGYSFTINLNAARFIDRFYISSQPDSAVSDRLIIHFAWKFKTTPETFARYVYTSAMWAGMLAFAGAVLFRF